VPAITLTSKRQATFPAKLCAELNLRPGDAIDAEPADVAGERVWILRPRRAPARPWVGRLAAQTTAERHDMESVRASIAARRGRGGA
jgi:bifunctional DNA-binding transcriptional regulator/antitoxin component of YhaV-PrlF toxin-antitoxin module